MSSLNPDRDLSKLDATFRERVLDLVRAMNARGYDAYVFEAWRSEERAAEMVRRGTGKRLTMHRLGLAVDILSRSKMWDPPISFWTALGEESRALGLTWGGNFRSRVDRPHVQALPADRDHWANTATEDELAAAVVEHLAWSDPDQRTTVREDHSVDKVVIPGPPKPPHEVPRGRGSVGSVDQAAPTPAVPADPVDLLHSWAKPDPKGRQ